MEPEKRTGSWGMMEILDRSFSKGTEPVSLSSIVMVPLTCPRRNRAASKDDFPAPVLPTIPIYIFEKTESLFK